MGDNHANDASPVDETGPRKEPISPTLKSLLVLASQARHGAGASPAQEALPTHHPKGQECAERLRKTLAGMLDSAAQARGLRRRATALDVTDYEAAFDDLVNPVPRPKWLEVTAEVSGFVAGSFLGYGINIWTSDNPYSAIGIVSGLAGLVVGGLAIIMKHIKLN